MSDVQLESLIQFIKSKGVKYYDLQLELADHFASAIEEKWQTRPELILEDEVTKIYLAFGDRGFKKLIQTKSQALEKKWLRKSWSYFKEFFTFPKFIITILLTLIFHQILNWSSNPVVIFRCCGLLILSTGIFTSIFLWWKKPLKVPIFVYDRVHIQILTAVNFAFVFLLHGSELIIAFLFSLLNLETWGLAIFLSVNLIFFYGMIVHVSQKNYQDFQRMYASFPIPSN